MTSLAKNGTSQTGSSSVEEFRRSEEKRINSNSKYTVSCLLHRLFQGQASADFDARGGIMCERGARAGGLEASAERERWVMGRKNREVPGDMHAKGYLYEDARKLCLQVGLCTS